MADITLAQMLKYETILGVVSRFKAAGTQLSNFYGLSIGSAGTERAGTGRVVGWDIFDNTRTMAKARSPYSGPARTRPKPVGKVQATCVRLYESIDIIHEKVYGTRPLGGAYGNVDRTGQGYVGRQIKFGIQRMSNSLEFMVSRMFRGGFDIEIDGEDHLLTENGSGDISVDFQIPAANTGQIPLASAEDYGGSDGDDVIDAAWDDPSADIIKQLLVLNKVSERQTGYPITEFWIDSTTYSWLLDNTQLQSVGGSAYRVFDTQTGQEISTIDGNSRMSGLTVVFRAMPQYNFHIYDAVLNVSGQVDSDAVGDVSQFIPTGYCLATPAPDGLWLGQAVGGEPIRKQEDSEVEYVEGMDAWTKRMNDPPGEELRVLSNTLPILYIPKAVYWIDVDF